MRLPVGNPRGCLWMVRAPMPVLPKPLFVLGTSFLTALASRRLKQAGRAVRAQHATLRLLIDRIAATEFGRDTGVERGMPYAKFRARVPLRGPDQFAPWIERMVRGESNVLWPGACALYALTSGTSGGEPKRLPVTGDMLAHFRRAAQEAMLCYTARTGHAGVVRGRHLFLGGSTALAPLGTETAGRSFAGNLGCILGLTLPRWAEEHLHEPSEDIARMPESPRKTAAIVARTRSLDITLIAGTPTALVELVEAMNAGGSNDTASSGYLQSSWPNLECLVHGGAMIGPYQDQLRRATGPAVRFHEVYASAEGLIAAQDAEPQAGLRLLADAGLFFEFLPLRDYEPSLPAGLGARAVPLEEVRAGEDYVLVLTTPAGLCRYVGGDIVRFVGTEPPRLVWAGRTRLQLDAFEEHVLERDLTDVLVSICQRHNWSITRFHVAPLFVASRTGPNRGGHEWWVELRPGTVETPTGPLIAGEIDQDLAARHAGYRQRRRSGVMEPPIVRLVMPGFFSHWLQHHAARTGRVRLSRCRGDRQIADQLTALACFHPD